MALSPKHRNFCEEYLKTWNATEAYLAAYPKSSRDAARRNASRLMTNDDIREEIQQRVDEQTMSANEVLSRLAEQARGEHGKYINEYGAVDLPQLIADGKGHLIKGVKETAHGKTIEFYDAQAALVHIGKHHRLFADKLDVNVHATTDITADERAEAAKELEAWQREQQQKKNAAKTSSG